jgi:hypothetical protein
LGRCDPRGGARDQGVGGGGEWRGSVITPDGISRRNMTSGKSR